MCNVNQSTDSKWTRKSPKCRGGLKFNLRIAVFIFTLSTLIMASTYANSNGGADTLMKQQIELHEKIAKTKLSSSDNCKKN